MPLLLGFILALTVSARAEIGPFFQQRIQEMDHQLDLHLKIAEIENRAGLDKGFLAEIKKKRADFERLKKDLRKKGDVAWLADNTNHPSQEDQRMVFAVASAIPGLNINDIYFVGPSEQIREFLNIQGNITGRVQTVMSPRGLKRAIMIDTTSTPLEKLSLLTHEGFHLSHRLREESMPKLLEELERNIGQTVDKLQVITFATWIEEGYTQSKTLNLLDSLVGPLQSDSPDSVRRIFQEAKALSTTQQIAEFDESMKTTYEARVAFVRGLIACGGKKAIEDFSEKDEYAEMLNFLGGAQNLLMIAQEMMDLKISSTWGNAKNDPKFQQMIDHACNRSLTQSSN